MVSLARRPPGAADVIDLAAARVREAIAPLLAVTAIPVVPAATFAASAPLWEHALEPYVIAVPLTLAGLWALAACGLVLGAGGLGRRPPAISLLARAALKLPAVLALTLMSLVEVAFFTALAVVPGIARIGRLQAALPVLLLERAHPVLAMRRSRFLTHGSELLGVRAMVGGIFAAACLAAAPIAVLLLAVPLPSGGSQTLADTRLLVAAMCLGMLVIPMIAAIQFATFLVRREQLEALDLQLALQALDVATERRAPVQVRG
jgi:hypothetical protein